MHRGRMRVLVLLFAFAFVAASAQELLEVSLAGKWTAWSPGNATLGSFSYSVPGSIHTALLEAGVFGPSTGSFLFLSFFLSFDFIS